MTEERYNLRRREKAELHRSRRVPLLWIALAR